jgi:hypothetical protein
MLSAKSKGIFAEVNRFRVAVAVTSSSKPPYVVEKVSEISADKSPEEIRKFISDFAGGKNQRYVFGNVAVYPDSRRFYRHSVDAPAKLKESGYLEEVIRSQAGMDLASSSVVVLNAGDGLPFDPTRSLAAQRELLVVGAGTGELRQLQDRILSYGIYPERMEIGSLPLVGTVIGHAKTGQIKRPILILEIEPKATTLYVVTSEHVDLCRTIPAGFDSMLPVISSELGVKDEKSARSMIYSNTFDFAELGQKLLTKLLKEIRSTTGFYEVQTGQSIGSVMLNLLPPSLDWVRPTISKSLGVETLKLDIPKMVAPYGVTFAPQLVGDGQLARLCGLWSLMTDHEPLKEAQPAA